MLSWSLRRRLIYLAIALVVIGIIVVLAFIIMRPVPSCFDGKLNQDELGVDCGGSCQKVCPAEILPLRPIWRRIFRVDDGKYDVAALVKNPNLRHGTQGVKYAFRIWNQDNLLINITHGEAYFNPKEDLVLFKSRVDVGKHLPARVEFEFEGSPVWQKIDRTPPKLLVSGKRFLNEPTPRLSSTIKNDSLVPVRNIEVYAVLSDTDQNAVAVSSTFLEELPAGESREAVFTWPKPFPVSVAFVDVSPHFDWRQLPE